jgi:hypothetical protein
MTTRPAPLLFPEILAAERLDQLTTPNELTQEDLDWLRHISLPSYTQRAAKTPPMFAEKILLQAEKKTPIALAGCFALSTSSSGSSPHTGPGFLYTPMEGIRKFDNPVSLETAIGQRLQDTTQRNDLYSLLSVSQRSELLSTSEITQTRQIIEGDIFKDQLASIESAQHLNASSMVNELVKLPSLTSMLDQILNEMLPKLDYRQARLALGKGVRPGGAEDIGVTESMPLTDAVLIYFHHQGWPPGHYGYITFPGTTSSPYTAAQWLDVITRAATQLIPALTRCIEGFWKKMTGSFYLSRRKLLEQVIHDGLWASILAEREKGQLTQAQSQELIRMFRPSSQDKTPLFIETIRLGERASDYVELAGSLMISGKDHYLYTPIQGIRKVDHYSAFRDALLTEPNAAMAKEAVYSLLDLEECNRFLRFDEPQVSGKPADLPIAEYLADSVLEKQQKNLHYALEMSRQDDVDAQALVDKALDIRAFINKNLLSQPTAGHWGTHPAFYGNLRSSNLRADQLERNIKSYTDIAQTFDELFTRLPNSGGASLYTRPRDLLSQLTNVFSLGIRAEAELRARNETLPSIAHELINTVFTFDADYPGRSLRTGVRGFRPDVYSLTLKRSDKDETVQLPLANCFLLTERGGLDTPYSGMGILWTPAEGLQAFSSVEAVTRRLNHCLLDSRKRFAFLANLPSAQRRPHAQYQLESYELIEENVLLNRMKSFITYFEAEHAYLSTLKAGDWHLTGATLQRSLQVLLGKGVPNNLERATRIARADKLRHTLPAWLGTAALDEQRFHVELLEQYKNSASEGKDYLDGIEPVRTYVQRKLQTILAARFPQKKLNPETVQITPTLAVVGAASSLTDFALCHVDVTEKSFQVSSTSTQPLPDGLDETAVRQILSSLDGQTTFRQALTQGLSGVTTDVHPRRQRFCRQLPWQLLQYAHALHLQQRLSATAFDLIHQVLDMPDAIAREAVQNASAIFRPLELIKTGGATAVKAAGLYVISSSADTASPHILYAPYHDGHQLTEFKDEASIIAAFNAPGALQDLLIRRLPEDQQATFKHLLASTLGKVSEITLAANPISANLLDTLYDDNGKMLTDMVSTRTQKGRHVDWSTVLHVLSAGARFVGRHLPGKLSIIGTLWDSYDDFKTSSQAFQQGDWKAGLHNFIGGAAEMVSLGFLNRDDTFGLLEPIEPASSSPLSRSDWTNITSTAAPRTDLQPFEAVGISLSRLKELVDGMYEAVENGRLYIPLAGKVFQIAKYNQAWRIIHDDGEGPLVTRSPGRTWEIDPQRQTIRFGQAGSTIAMGCSDYFARETLNVEARGMIEIRRRYPQRATVIVQALETARFYSRNALDNFAQLKRNVVQGSRLDTFLKLFFGVVRVDSQLIGKIEAAISPMCTALADPYWEQLNSNRIVVGHLRFLDDRASAFVMEPSPAGRIYLTQRFFEPELDWYKSAVPDFFDVEAHAQASILIHETSHQFFDTFDFTYLDATCPFLDLIPTTTHYGRERYETQKDLQLNGFSLTTPKSKLFTQWDSADNTQKGFELLPKMKSAAKEILKISRTRNLDEARDAFLNPIVPDQRIDLILRNADSLTLLICEMGRQLDPPPSR